MTEQIPWPEFSEIMKAQSQQKRANNRQSSAALLAGAGIQFDEHNDGAHLVVKPESGPLIDFWPGTGLWIERQLPRKHRRGVRSLISHVNQQHAQAETA